uniref:Uncharacterized protein n=1 Tax=Salix viminalis TaxID=40686 RepID=A0A6N2MYS2_SALVM
MATKHFESLRGKLAGFSIFPIRGCINGCRDPTQTSGFGSSVWNLSDRPVELQIRVGSILKKVHTLKPGSSKRLKCKNIYKTYMPGRSGGGAGGGGNKNLLYYYDEAFHPYIWVHDTGGDFSRMVKQQYISLEDLRDYLRSEFSGIIKEAPYWSARNPGLIFADFVVEFIWFLLGDYRLFYHNYHRVC